jgi:hypothetical protein
MAESACPVCGSPNVADVEYRSSVPVGQNILFRDRAAAKACATGVLDIAGCEGCGFLWNRAYDPHKLSYDQDYENDQTSSVFFSRHVAAVIRIALDCAPPGELDYVEIGCGQGHFLKQIAVTAGARLRSATGFDPAWRGDAFSLPPNTTVIAELFGEVHASRMKRAPNLVVSRHTIEHIRQPVEFLSAIRRVATRNDCRLILETPCAEWILRQRAFHDLFYEHCSIFSEKALGIALQQSGWQLERIERAFGGQYLVAVARTAADAAAVDDSKVFMTRLAAERSQYVSAWVAEVKRMRAKGPVMVWGAGAKGASFATLVDPRSELLDCFVDINPGKQGGFLPCTGHAVVAPSAASVRRPGHVLVMNPNYLDEIRGQCEALGIQAALVPVE